LTSLFHGIIGLFFVSFCEHQCPCVPITPVYTTTLPWLPANGAAKHEQLFRLPKPHMRPKVNSILLNNHVFRFWSPYIEWRQLTGRSGWTAQRDVSSVTDECVGAKLTSEDGSPRVIRIPWRRRKQVASPVFVEHP